MTENIDKTVEECTSWIGQWIQSCHERDHELSHVESACSDQWVEVMDEYLQDCEAMQLQTFSMQSFSFVVKLLDTVKKQRVSVEQTKQKLVETQEAVIGLQSQLLEKKEQQISAISAAVQSTVSSSVKNEVKSFSEVVKKGTTVKPAMSQVSLKKTVKEVVEQEDRSRNVMVFGLPDRSEEETDEAVKSVLLAIGEKPKIMEARRLRIFAEGKTRPVILSVGSSLAASQIISKRRKLKESAVFKSVYISPDRTVEERLARKDLIKQRKQHGKKEGSGAVVRELRGRTVIAT